MDAQRIFRKVALDRLASPDELDQLLPVVDRRGWVALLAFALLIAAACVWSVRGSLPQNINGTGILVTREGVVEIIPTAGGRVTEVTVHVGELVEKGRLVARLAQPELELRLKEAKAALKDIDERHAEMLKNAGKDLPLQRRHLAQQAAAIQKAIRSAQNIKRASEHKISTQKPLVAAGLLLKQNLLETMQLRDAAMEKIEEAQSQLAQVAVRRSELAHNNQENVAASERKIRESRRVIKELTRELASKTNVVAGTSGRILEVFAEPGIMLATGEPVLSLDQSGSGTQTLDAIVFVPSVYGKQIKPGMRVLISPTTIKQEEFGMIVGQVKSVSDFPTTVKGMQRILKNDKLVASLSGGDAPYEVRAQLFTDRTTPSGYRWSSSTGPTQHIEGGSMATAYIAVAYKRPVDLIIPLLRENTGL